MLCDIFGISDQLQHEVQMDVASFLQGALHHSGLDARKALYSTLEAKLVGVAGAVLEAVKAMVKGWY